jgi:hypothetical protein
LRKEVAKRSRKERTLEFSTNKPKILDYIYETDVIVIG